MRFKNPQSISNPWVEKLEDDLIRETRLLIVKYGIDVGYKLDLSENKERVIGFHFFLEEETQHHYSCLDELERALKNKPFI